MKIVKRDPKHDSITLMVEIEDDLWTLHNVVDGGDHVRSLTYRREEKASDKLRPDRGEKRRMMLTINVEKVEFHTFTDHLRIHGTIEEGPQDLGAYHTLNVGIGTKLTVKKKLSRHHLDLIKQAVEDSKRPRIAFVAIEDDNAVVAVARAYGLQEIGWVHSGSQGKQYASKSDDSYFEEIYGILSNLDEGTPLIILGPGFTKEHFAKFVRDRAVRDKRTFQLTVEATGQSGLAGINEAFRKGSVAKFAHGARIEEEINLVEDALVGISSGKLIAYGEAETRKALEFGAAGKMLITDAYARTDTGRQLLDVANTTRVETRVVSTNHDGGKKLEGLGSVLAFLRFKME